MIEAHLDWLIGLGRYASAMYGRTDRDGASGLLVEVRDKSYAPPLVRFVVDVDNESKDVNVSVGSRITFMDVTSAGSELRLDTSLGAKLRFRTELLQPLSGKGPVRRGAFVAPFGLYERTSESFYDDVGALRAIYSRQRLGAGLDLGWTIGRTTEIRIGPEIDYVRNTTRVGDELPQSTGREMGARFRFEHDGQDRAYFPTHGARISTAVTWITTAPYAPRPFGRAEGAFQVALSTRTSHTITFHASGGAGLGTAPPLLYRFSLGGPFRLGAFPPNSLRGSSFFLARAHYRMPLKRLPAMLGDRLYFLDHDRDRQRLRPGRECPGQGELHRRPRRRYILRTSLRGRERRQWRDDQGVLHRWDSSSLGGSKRRPSVRHRTDFFQGRRYDG